MSLRLSSVRPALRAAAIAVATAAALSPSASAAEVVSRVGGEGSLPFPASLVTASSSGRYVVLHLGTPNTRAAATGPEAEVTSPSGYVIRDRVAQTIAPLKLEQADGSPLPGRVVQISADGQRVLVLGDSIAVVSVATGKPLALPTAPGIVTGAQLSDDGTQAIVATTGTDTMNNPAKDNALYRGPVGGTGSPVLALSGIRLADASADLQTVLYTRELPKVVDLADQARSFTGKAIGIKQGSGAPHVLAQSSYHQTRRSTETCTPDYNGIRTLSTQVYAIALSADGGRAVWSRSAVDSEYQGLSIYGYRLRQAGGTISEFNQQAYYSPEFQALGATHDVALIPQLQFKNSPIHYTRTLVDGDRTLISSDVGGVGPEGPGTRYVTAESFDPGTVTAPSTLSFTDAEPVDTNARVSDATFANCNGAPPAAVGPIERYTLFQKTAPTRSTASIGTLFFSPDPVGYRKATSATAEVKIFGISIWKRSLAPNTVVTLPKPWPWLPTTVRVTVQPAPAGTTAAKPIVKDYAIYASR